MILPSKHGHFPRRSVRLPKGKIFWTCLKYTVEEILQQLTGGLSHYLILFIGLKVVQDFYPWFSMSRSLGYPTSHAPRTVHWHPPGHRTTGPWGPSWLVGGWLTYPSEKWWSSWDWIIIPTKIWGNYIKNGPKHQPHEELSNKIRGILVGNHGDDEDMSRPHLDFTNMPTSSKKKGQKYKIGISQSKGHEAVEPNKIRLGWWGCRPDTGGHWHWN